MLVNRQRNFDLTLLRFDPHLLKAIQQFIIFDFHQELSRFNVFALRDVNLPNKPVHATANDGGGRVFNDAGHCDSRWKGNHEQPYRNNTEAYSRKKYRSHSTLWLGSP